MSKEQEAIARAGIGTAADEVLRGAGQGGEVGEEPGSGVAGGGNSAGQSSQADRAGGSNDLGIDPAEAAAPSVQGCNDVDKVARQLCEAATQEADPFLRAALWDEYNEYRKILSRQ
jgi:hypothetical protein